MEKSHWNELICSIQPRKVRSSLQIRFHCALVWKTEEEQNVDGLLRWCRLQGWGHALLWCLRAERDGSLGKLYETIDRTNCPVHGNIFPVEYRVSPDIANRWVIHAVHANSIYVLIQSILISIRIGLANKMTTTVDIPRGFQHIASIVCGMAISYFTLGLDSLYSLGFTTITYLLFVTITRMNLKHYGVTLTFFCLVSLTIGCVRHNILSCSWIWMVKAQNRFIDSLNLFVFISVRFSTQMYQHGIVCAAPKWLPRWKLFRLVSISTSRKWKEHQTFSNSGVMCCARVM